jgi:uncharacterized protein (TIGR01440 family)
MIDMEVRLEREMKQLLNDFKEQISIKPNQILVIGCSTSEVIGSRIGSAGSSQVAEIIFQEIKQFSQETGLSLAFQCCEHLNRALIIERDTQDHFQFEEVTVVPVCNAGGSMAAQAYRSFNNPCVVEHIKADYGIDIGDTLIGMHLKHVAVPIRVSVKQIGEAHITLAKTRPKLIGGERAVYCV